MNKNRFYLILIISLLISNIVLLVLYLNPPLRIKGPRNIIIDKLAFDEQQIKKYDVLITQHRELIFANETQINTLKNKLYQQLNEPTDSLIVDNLAKSIAELGKKGEMIHFRHFEEIRKICKPNQKESFEELVNNLTELFPKKPFLQRKLRK